MLACKFGVGPKSLRSLDVQDTTSHPTWTGEKSALSGQDGRAAEFLRKFAKPGDTAAAKE